MTCLRCFVVTAFLCNSLLAEDGWIQYDGHDGPGAGRNIVLVSGDEEYRTEETMPMLAQILSVRHGFDCTVVFSMSKDGRYIDPNNRTSLEGIEALKFADLMIIGTRFRAPSDKAMSYIDEYVAKGKPIIGLRTATHAFNFIEGPTLTTTTATMETSGQKDLDAKFWERCGSATTATTIGKAQAALS